MRQPSYFLRQFLRPALLALLAFFLLDVIIAFSIRRSGILYDVVDIQTPATLYAKLDVLRTFKGQRVVFLGDSVVYGRRMEAAGDRDWRRHTIPEHVEALLQRRLSGEPIRVLNLGMNGALPSDFEQIVRLITPLKPDCVVADVSLRAFSADFARSDTRFSRPWLPAMHLDRNFKMQTQPDSTSWFEAIENSMRNFALRYWWLYRVRDFVQWRVFDGEPAEAVRRVRAWLDGIASAKQAGNVDPLEEVLLTLKAKSRYDTVSLDEGLPQVAALTRMLDMLSATSTCSVFFYASEEKKQRDELIEPGRYREQLRLLSTLFSRYQKYGIRYVESTDAIAAQHYIDYGHLNNAGNAQVALSILEGGLEQALLRHKANR